MKPTNVNWDYTLQTFFYGNDTPVTLDELYQAFKVRLLADIKRQQMKEKRIKAKRGQP
jgi:hypothetical protein